VRQRVDFAMTCHAGPPSNFVGTKRPHGKATRPKRNPRRRRLHVARSRRAAGRARGAPRGSAQSCRETIPTSQSYSHFSTRSKKSERRRPGSTLRQRSRLRRGAGALSRWNRPGGHVRQPDRRSPAGTRSSWRTRENTNRATFRCGTCMASAIALLALGGPAAASQTGRDRRPPHHGGRTLRRSSDCAREAGTQRLVIVSSTESTNTSSAVRATRARADGPSFRRRPCQSLRTRRSGRRRTRGQHQAMTMRRWSAPWARRAATSRSRCCGRG